MFLKLLIISKRSQRNIHKKRNSYHLGINMHQKGNYIQSVIFKKQLLSQLNYLVINRKIFWRADTADLTDHIKQIVGEVGDKSEYRVSAL